MRHALLFVLTGGLICGQTFEVASIKPSPPPDHTRGMRVSAHGGPGTDDPERFTAENFDLSNLVTMAYGIDRYQLSAPDWLEGARFDIVAKVPAGTTMEQFSLMMRNLLAERFKLEVHHDQKAMQSYEMTVGKNGPKLTESTDVPDTAAPGGPPAPFTKTLGADGFPVLPPGRDQSMIMMKGRARMRVSRMSMAQLAVRLAGQLGQPVKDATGLTGKYDFTLSWVTSGLTAQGGAADDPGPDIFGALQQQLGLMLESKKALVDVVVVDHIEKLPTAN